MANCNVTFVSERRHDTTGTVKVGMLDWLDRDQTQLSDSSCCKYHDTIVLPSSFPFWKNETHYTNKLFDNMCSDDVISTNI